MGKNRADGKSKGKGSQLVIRIDKAEREAFVRLCEDLDTSAAREIRRFMRGFVATHGKRTAGDDQASSVASPTQVDARAEPQAVDPDVSGTAPLPLTEPSARTGPQPA